MKKARYTMILSIWFHTCNPSNIIFYLYTIKGLPKWLRSKESICQCKRCRFNPSVMKIPWRRKWQPAPVSLPGKSHAQRSLGGYSPRDCKRVRHNLGTKQQQHTHNYIPTHICIECIQIQIYSNAWGWSGRGFNNLITREEGRVRGKSWGMVKGDFNFICNIFDIYFLKLNCLTYISWACLF